MFLTRSRLVLLACLLCFGLVTPAQAADDWNAGKKAFKDGDYESALVFFQAARDAGRTGPAILYNIAVTQYKIGRYSDAYATFELLAGQFPKRRALAEYNMGLAAAMLDEPDKAQGHFRRAYELSGGDETLRTLASRQLREVDPGARTASRWNAAVGIRAGYDDNVALLDEAGLTAGSTTDSPLVEMYASVTGFPAETYRLRVEGSAYLVRYVDADDFDQSQLSGGVIYDWRDGNWRLSAGLQASTGAIGGDAYDRKIGPKASVTRYLNGNSNVELRYRYDDVSEADSVYAGLAGSRQLIDARYRWYENEHYLQFRYANESNDRRDAGFSPDRNRLSADYRYQPERGFGFEVGATFRTSDYDDLDLPREEDLTLIRSALTYLFPNEWLVFVEAEHSSNDSTDPVFAYDRNQVTLGARRFF